MSQRLTSWIGWTALAGFAASGLFAWSQVEQRVVVTLAEDGGVQVAGDQQLALLQEDVRTLRADLSGLAQSVGQGLEDLHEALNAAANERELATRAALATEIGELRLRLGESAQREPEASGEGAPPSPGEAGVPVAARAHEPAPRPTRGFLSFQLPSESFSFGERQRFEVITSLSRVGFDAESTLHDFSGTSEEVRGEWIVCLARPEEGTAGSVAISAQSLDTRNVDRDAEMRSLLDAQARPVIEYRIEGFTPAAGGVDPGPQALRGTVRGQMTIRGAARPFEMPVRLHVDESRRLVVEGEAALELSDYGVVAPNKLGVISMQDEVRIWIALRARCLGRVQETADAR